MKMKMMKILIKANKKYLKCIKKDGKLASIDIETKDEKPKTIEINGLFIAVGRVPESENFAKLVNTDEAGYIEAAEDCSTNVEGIFVAGDNRVKEVRQLTTATADGTVAATNIIKYLNDKGGK